MGLALFGQLVDQEGPVLQPGGALQGEVAQLAPRHEDELADPVRHPAVLRHVQGDFLEGVVRGLVGDAVVGGEGVVDGVADEFRHFDGHLGHLELVVVLHTVDNAPSHCKEKIALIFKRSTLVDKVLMAHF